jgi:hypothetical protein
MLASKGRTAAIASKEEGEKDIDGGGDDDDDDDELLDEKDASDLDSICGFRF